MSHEKSQAYERIPVRHHRMDVDAREESKRRIRQLEKDGWEQEDFKIENNVTTVWMRRRRKEVS